MAVVKRLGYSRREAAQVLGVSLSLIDALIQRGDLQVLRISREGEDSQRPRVVVPVAALNAYIAKSLGWSSADRNERAEAAGVSASAEA